MAVVVAFDFDLRKNFEPQIAQRYWAALVKKKVEAPSEICVLVLLPPLSIDRS